MLRVMLLLSLMCVEAKVTLVETPCGRMIGRAYGNVNAFEGIPFGVQTRFQPSIKALCWRGVLNATYLGPACWQPVSVVQGMSEDCLNLNVYVPRSGDGGGPLLPVMVYVYGGGNMEGTNAQDGAGPLLALHLNAVVVIPNYRLGGLGYLVDVKSNLRGNYGISDILTALEFVRPLLESLGGDAKRITLMGQSSGGTNILALLASPRAKGLFQGAITLSASPNITQDVYSASRMQSQTLLPLIGCLPGDRSCLMNASAENVTAACEALQGGQAPPSFNPPNFPWAPNGNGRMGLVVVDGSIVARPLLDSLRVPIVDVPLFVQSVQCEQDPSDVSVDRLQNSNGTQFRTWLTDYLSQQGWVPAVAANISQRVKELYMKQFGPGQETIEWGLETWLADLGVTCGNDEVAQIAAKSFKSPVFRSHLIAPPSHPFFGKRFAFHTWDYPVSALAFWNGFKPEDSDLKLGATIRRSWTSMVHQGRAIGFRNGGCTQIRAMGMLGPCSDSGLRCTSLEKMGFGSEFWWVN